MAKAKTAPTIQIKKKMKSNLSNQDLLQYTYTNISRNSRNMAFLEAQVDKLQKERDRLKLAVEQFMGENNKGFESQNPGKLQLMVS